MKKVGCFAMFGAIFFILLALNMNSLSLQDRKGETIIQHEVAVTLKLVQVYVTDNKGNPVVDLMKEDFLVYDKGKKQEITEFERHILQLPQSEAGIQPEMIQATPLPPSRELMSRKFFLLFDFAYNNARGIIKAKEAALHFIDTQLQPSDEIGVLSYSTIKSLKLHEYLTSDQTKVRNVVREFDIREIAGRAENFEEEYWYKTTGNNPLDASKSGGVFQKQYGVLESEGQASTGKPSPEWDKFKAQEGSSLHAFYFVRKMSEFSKALRYIPGYKYIILFSSGIPYSLMYGIHQPTDSWGARIPQESMLQQGWDLGNRLLQQQYDEMLKELAASNSTVFTLDTENMGAMIAVNSRLKGGFTLQTMASSTGGKYFGDINNYEKHLEKIQNLTECYYVLGYYIDEKWDGKYQKINVKVNRPGCNVHAQKGYFNPKPFSKYNKTERMLHLVDLALTEKPIFQTPLRFPMTVFTCSIEGKSNVAVFSKIPMGTIQEFSGEDVEIVSIIFDEEDNIIMTERDERDFSKIPEGNIYYSLFSLSPGQYKYRLVIRNLETGKGAVAASPIEIYKESEKGTIELLPPLLLVPEKETFYIKGSLPRGIVEISSWEEYFHFDFSRYAPLVEAELKCGSIVSAVVPFSVSGINDSEVTILVSLIKQTTGEITPLQVKILSDSEENGLNLRFVEIQIPELPSGDYDMHFAAQEAKSKSFSQMTRILKIK